MDNIKALLDTVEEYINQKLEVFHQVRTLTLEQAKVLEIEEVDLQYFEKFLDTKDQYLQNLNQINEDLSSVLVQNEQLLSSGLEAHKEQIEQIKDKLEQQTLIGEDIKKIEDSNKKRLNLQLNIKREGIHSFKKSKKAASKYSQNMSSTHQNEMSYFMDRKK
ncbi:MAG: hypothetical protein CVV02_00840 [Firmicutes bacterium HGW-Firmicutes-7]|nr:MAG: hypothetical protein CVV02_00840 [Firmicutes bacterium HGW-Firmicutes-7]